MPIDNLKNYNIFEISRALWSHKFLIVFCIFFSTLISWGVFFSNKQQEYHVSFVKIITYDPNISTTSFNYPIFTNNLKTFITQNNFQILSENLIRLSTRTFDQFGNIEIKEKKFLEEQRNTLLELVSEFSELTRKDIIYELENYKERTTGIPEYYEFGLLNLYPQTKESPQFYRYTFELEFLLKRYFNAESNNVIVKVSPLSETRLIRSSPAFYLLLGLFGGGIISIILIAIIKIKENL